MTTAARRRYACQSEARRRASGGSFLPTGRLSLHVPEPTVRPGGKPDFSHVGFAAAGEARRPPVDADPAEIRDLAYSLIRVIDEAGAAVGPWAGALTVADLRQGLRDMMLTRAYDARMLL